VLAAIDDQGRVKLIDEIYEPGLSPEQQGEKVILAISSHNIDPKDVYIWAGPEIFESKPGEVKSYSSTRTAITPGWSMYASNGKRIADVYRGMGLHVIPAVGANTPAERINGWAAVNQYLDKPGFMTIYEGRCPNLVVQFETAPPSPTNSNDVDTTAVEHLLDGCRFLLRNNLMTAEEAPPEKPYMDAADREAIADEEGWNVSGVN
jgi:hypothetical protein